jgi:hypothetical protein
LGGRFHGIARITEAISVGVQTPNVLGTAIVIIIIRIIIIRCVAIISGSVGRCVPRNGAIRIFLVSIATTASTATDERQADDQNSYEKIIPSFLPSYES